MTAVLKREITAYLERVDWGKLIQLRLKSNPSAQTQEEDRVLSDPIYSNRDVLANEEKANGANSSDHIRFGLGSGDKSKLQKVCKLRGIVMSALLRLMIVRYVEKGLGSNFDLFDFSDTESSDFFGFNISIEMDKKFGEVCKKRNLSKSRVLRFLSSQYLDRVKWSEGQRPLNDDPEFPVHEVKDEELGDFKFTHIVLNKTQKNKFVLACRSRGIRPSSLFRLMIARFMEDPTQFKLEEQPISLGKGRTSVEFSCPEELHDLFGKTQKMTSVPVVVKQMLLDYLSRVDWHELKENMRKSSDTEFPNEEIWEENSGEDGDVVVAIPLTKRQKKDLERVCKIRDINISALCRVMLGRYVVANRF